ncbi:MAG TPA: hypothetical protein VGL00_23040, partial [Terracidiphilus sp.]
MRLHARLFAWILLAGVASAAAYLFAVWPVYEAECLVYIPPAPPQLRAAAGTQILATDAVTPPSSTWQQFRDVTRGEVLEAALHKMPPGWRSGGESDSAAIERLRGAISLERLDDSSQISIKARASQAALAADTANAVGASFVESASTGQQADSPWLQRPGGPGTTHVSARALPPLHPSVLPLLPNVFAILLAAVAVALGSAVVANAGDPRVYVAADLERAIGCSPLAQVPDFQQVASQVGEECLLRVAEALEHACRQNGWKRCMITGAAHGVGASTLAARVTAMLEGMGRSTVVVNASATPAPSRETLLQQIAGMTDEETIALTDALPLLGSGETRYLARFVDSAIVVIQSGLTTHAQLREIAKSLQRLDVAAVGFVINRVSISKADAA